MSRSRRTEEPRGSSAAEGGALAPRTTGEVVQARLDSVRRNWWNFNELSPHESASLREGLRTEGWLACFALLIWRTDEEGAPRNVIIDGEHRHEEALALGFVEGPMVFLDGLTEAKAREMTAKLSLIRGQPNEVRLSDLLRALPANLLSSTSLGLDAERLARLTRVGLPEERPGGVLPPEDFPDVGAEGAVKTDHKCPRCSYEWSGATK